MTKNNINCDVCFMPMDLTDEDRRTNYYEAIYYCRDCGKEKIHKMEFDQNGLVISDIIVKN